MSLSPNILSRNEVRYWQDQPPDLIASTQDYHFYRRASKEGGFDVGLDLKKERQKRNSMSSFVSRPRQGPNYMPALKKSTSSLQQDIGKEDGHPHDELREFRQPSRLYETDRVSRRILSPTQELLGDNVSGRNRRPWSIVNVEKWLEEQQFFLHLPEAEDVSIPLSPSSVTGPHSDEYDPKLSNKEIFTWPHRVHAPKESKETLITPTKPPQVYDMSKNDLNQEILTWPNRRSSKSSKRGRLTAETFDPPPQNYSRYQDIPDPKEKKVNPSFFNDDSSQHSTDYLENLLQGRVERRQPRNFVSQVPSSLRAGLSRNDNADFKPHQVESDSNRKQGIIMDGKKMKNDHTAVQSLYSTDTLSSRKTDTVIDYSRSYPPESRASDKNSKHMVSDNNRQRGSRKVDTRSPEPHEVLSQGSSLSEKNHKQTGLDIRQGNTRKYDTRSPDPHEVLSQDSSFSDKNSKHLDSDVRQLRQRNVRKFDTRSPEPHEVLSQDSLLSSGKNSKQMGSDSRQRSNRRYDVKSPEPHDKLSQDSLLCSPRTLISNKTSSESDGITLSRTQSPNESRVNNTRSAEPQDPNVFSPRSARSNGTFPDSDGITPNRAQSPDNQHLVSQCKDNPPDITADTTRREKEGKIGFYVSPRKTPDSGIELDNQGDSVLRHGSQEAPNRRLEFRKVKALSWPKYTVISGVIPEAEKAKVTHVNSTPSSLRSYTIEEETASAADAPLVANASETCKDVPYISDPAPAQIGDSNVEVQEVRSPVASPTPNGDEFSPPNPQCAVEVDNEGTRDDHIEADMLDKKNYQADPVKNFSDPTPNTPKKTKISVQSSTEKLLNTASSEPILDNNDLPHVQNSELSKVILDNSFSGAARPSSLGGSTDNESKTGGNRKLGGGLRNLIKLHEKEIARVSGSILPPVSYRRQRSKDGPVYRHSAFGMDSLLKHAEGQKVDSKWKRHTASGFLDMADSDIEHAIMSEQSPKQGRESNDTDEQPNGISRKALERSNADDIVLPGSAIAIETVELQEDRDIKLPHFHRRPPPISPKPKAEFVRQKSRGSEPDFRDQSDGSDPIHDRSNRFSKHFLEASSQTELKVITEEDYMTYEDKILELNREKEKFDGEREELLKKLDEQKKIANAYQKLEDRYRKKVHELQKAMIKCTCGACITLNGNRQYPAEGSSTFPRQLKVLEEAEKPQEQVTVEKVDGILHELEAWLNTQQSSKAASSTEGSMSVQVHLPSQESVVSSFSDLTGTGTGTGTGPGYDNNPLQMLDQFDSTSV